MSGEKAVPVSTYFVGGFGRGADRDLAALEESEADLHYLGRSGVTSIKGLSIAFLDGTYDAEVGSKLSLSQQRLQRPALLSETISRTDKVGP